MPGPEGAVRRLVVQPQAHDGDPGRRGRPRGEGVQEEEPRRVQGQGRVDSRPRARLGRTPRVGGRRTGRRCRVPLPVQAGRPLLGALGRADALWGVRARHGARGPLLQDEVREEGGSLLLSLPGGQPPQADLREQQEHSLRHGAPRGVGLDLRPTLRPRARPEEPRRYGRGAKGRTPWRPRARGQKLAGEARSPGPQAGRLPRPRRRGAHEARRTAGEARGATGGPARWPRGNSPP